MFAMSILASKFDSVNLSMMWHGNNRHDHIWSKMQIQYRQAKEQEKTSYELLLEMCLCIVYHLLSGTNSNHFKV